MAIEITGVRFGSTERIHENASAYRWTEHESGQSGEVDPLALAEWIERHAGDAYVLSDQGPVSVGVVLSWCRNPYLRTYANGSWTDDLLKLKPF